MNGNANVVFGMGLMLAHGLRIFVHLATMLPQMMYRKNMIASFVCLQAQPTMTYLDGCNFSLTYILVEAQ